MKKIKTKNIFVILISIWLIDFLLTILGVNILGFTEKNPISSLFLNNYGIIGFLMLGIIGTFMISFLLFKVSYNKYNKTPMISLITGISVFCTIEFYAIINNLYWILK
jgi:hypothetical protein